MPEAYVPLRVASCFSFLRGASQPEALIRRAKALGYRRLALTDRDGLYGVVRAHQAAKVAGLRLIVGAELRVEGGALLLYPTDRAAYGRLSRLISLGRRRVGKGGISLRRADLEAHQEGLLAVHLGPVEPERLAWEAALFSDRLYVGVDRQRVASERSQESQQAAARLRLPLIATGGVLMAGAEDKPLQDVLSCIRLGLRLEEAGRQLLPNQEAHLKPPAEIAALYSDLPEAVEQTLELADRARFSLDELHQSFALELLPDGEEPMGYLKKLVERGAGERYPGGVPAEVRAQIEHELSLVERLGFAGYFLTVWDIVRYARSQGILCQGRGSAANSALCYCLGITSIDPVRMKLLFERFISAERGEPPDIDVDFEHERREEVMQYVFQKYGREHAAMVANFVCFRGRMAYREVGKVFGLDPAQTAALAKHRGHWSSGEITEAQLKEAGLDPQAGLTEKVVRLAEAIRGMPRHLGLHSGGFVITKEPLVELVPVENAAMQERTLISWDKRDLEALGLVKVDLLSLGMLSAIRRAFEYVQQTEGNTLSLATIPPEDARVYRMIQAADTIGTFQIESRAQRQLLPRLAPKTFYDLVVSVAIVRPGPIQGDMVHPYLRRRAGEEAIDYPHPALKEILGKTCGIPLFQEQVMKMAVAVAGFSPGEADALRRAIGWRSKLHIAQLHERLVAGMRDNGLQEAFAERIFHMIEGFGGYGFPESHAASFALIAYASAYLKRYHPAALLCGLLNSQPMGFYSQDVLIRDGQRHGVVILPPSVLCSGWDSALSPGDEARAVRWFQSSKHPEKEHTPFSDHIKGSLRYGLAVQSSLRLGLRVVRGLGRAEADAIVAARPFESVAELMSKTQLSHASAERLAAAGALSGLVPGRREALWQVMAAEPKLPLFSAQALDPEPSGLPEMSAFERLAADYLQTGMSPGRHPMSWLRGALSDRGILGSAGLAGVPAGRHVKVAGLVSARQKPFTASGVVFISLEDEDGAVNLIVYDRVMSAQWELAHERSLLMAQGKLQRDHPGVTNVIVERFYPLDLPSPAGHESRDYF